MRTWPLAFGAAAGAAGWGIYNAISPTGQGFGKSFVGTPGKGRLMALTFDDGPNTAWTPQLLELLDKHGVKATFFSIGHYARALRLTRASRLPQPASRRYWGWGRGALAGGVL